MKNDALSDFEVIAGAADGDFDLAYGAALSASDDFASVARKTGDKGITDSASSVESLMRGYAVSLGDSLLSESSARQDAYARESASSFEDSVLRFSGVTGSEAADITAASMLGDIAPMARLVDRFYFE